MNVFAVRAIAAIVALDIVAIIILASLNESIPDVMGDAVKVGMGALAMAAIPSRP